MKNLIQKHCALKLVPPSFHQHNLAEISTKSFKLILEDHCCCGNRLPYALMVTSPTPGRTNPQSTMEIQHNSHCISIFRYVWTILLQQNAPRPNVMRRTYLWKFQRTYIMVQACSIQLVPIHVTGTLPRPRMQSQKYQRRSIIGHCSLQTQKYHKTDNHTLRSISQGHPQPQTIS